MSGAGGKLIVKQSYGINRNMKNCVAYTIDHHLAYPCGHQVAVINTETKEQSFISATNSYQHQSLGITAVVASYFKKTIAVAEKCEPTAIITLYDSTTLRKKKLLNAADFGSNEVKCMAFSHDGKYFISQGAGPDWNLILWTVEKTVKMLSSVRISLSDDLPVNQVSFCPWDSSIIMVIGQSIFRLFRWVEGQLRPINCIVRREHANFISHCWIPEDTLILGTANGELLLIENLEYRGVMYPTAADALNLPMEELANPINCMLCTPRGFMVGTSNSDFRVFERNDDIKEKYQFEEAFRVPGNRGGIVCFAMGSDDTLVIVTDKQQLLYTSFSNLTQNKEVLLTGSGFENIFTPFHSPFGPKNDASITGIDVALWKQIIVTCGKDKTLRVWNANDKRMEYMKEFEEDPLTLSVHPSGIYVAIAFSDAVRIYSLLLDEIVLVREMQAKNITYVKFSRGGQYIAAAVGTNVIVYNTIDGNVVCTLRGHNNRVKSVVWMNFDSKMMTVGVEGVVYSWDLFPQHIMQHKRQEHFQGSNPISSGTGPMDGSKIFIATHDHKIKELVFNSHVNSSSNDAALVAVVNNNGVIVPVKELDIPYSISCMIYDDTRKILLMGTNNLNAPGCIISALTSPHLSTSLDYNTLHSSGLTAMCQSYDGNTIYSGDSSGNLCVSQFENASFTGKQAVSKREGMAAFEFTDEVVIHKSDLEHRRHQIEQLDLRVKELNQNNEHQIRLKEIEFKDRITEMSEKMNAQLTEEDIRYGELEREKKGIEADFSSKVANLERKQQDELKAMESKYKMKMNAEEYRRKELTEELENSHRRWNAENQALVESHQKYLQELTLEYEEKFLTEKIASKEMGHIKEKLAVNSDGYMNETEADGDREVATMKIKYDTKLKLEENTVVDLVAQHTLTKKNLQALSRDSGLQRDEIKKLHEKEQRLHDTIFTLEKDILNHKKEIREREETITDKEKRMFDLKKKNQELEKFRFVLDYKIKELKLQIAPRETEIATMSKQIEEMGSELQQYNKSSLALNLMIDELKLKFKGVQNELDSQGSRVATNNHLIDKFRRDLQEGWAKRGDKELFKKHVVNMYRVYVQDDAVAGAAAGKNGKVDMEDPQQAYNRDREQLERSLDSLRRAMQSSANANKREVGKMMRESVLLTNELNSLRRNSRYMELQKKAVDQAGSIGVHSDLSDLMDVLCLEKKKIAVDVAAKEAEPETLDQTAFAMIRLNTRSTALRLTSSDGKRTSLPGADGRSDQWEAWREIQMQYDQMRGLEAELSGLCTALNIDPAQVVLAIDKNLASLIF